VSERIALPLPVLQDPIKRVLLEQYAGSDVLLMRTVALKQPAIDLLAHLLARLCHLGPRRAGMISQMGYEPQLERVNPGQVTAVLEREPLDVVFSIEIPKIVVADRVARQMMGEKRAK